MPDATAERPARPAASTEAWLRARADLATAGGVRRAMMLGALGASLVVPQAWLLAHAVAPVVMDGAALADVLPWLLPIPALLLFRLVMLHAADRLALRAAGQLKAGIRADLLRHLAACPPRGTPSGEVAAIVIDAVDALEPYVARFMAHLGMVAAVPLVILAVVLPHDWISGLVLLVTAPVIPMFMVLVGSRAEQRNRELWQRLTRLSARLLDGLQRLTTLQAFNATAREARLLADAADEYRRSTMSVLRVAFLSSLALEFFSTVGIAVVAVLIGFRLLDAGLTFEVGFFALLLAPEFYAPLRQLGADYHARMEALTAAERIRSLLHQDGPAPGIERPAFATAITIRCEHIGFTWDAEQPTLTDVSLELRPGETVALIGPSGAGKSTMLSLLLGQMRPQVGRILVDGQDLATIDPLHWMARLALVPQRPHMFAGSVLDNIRLGGPSIGLDAVRDAARLAAADDFIMALPRGYDTPLGEHGQTLSGGQVQRIALARAFLKTHASILLVDEGTAGLDEDTEAAVAAAIGRLAATRTAIIVAHRLATVRLADRVVVLEGGRIVLQAPRAALERDGSRFFRLLRNGGAG